MVDVLSEVVVNFWANLSLSVLIMCILIFAFFSVVYCSNLGIKIHLFYFAKEKKAL